jgi:lysyl-tRNA synthetase class 2
MPIPIEQHEETNEINVRLRKRAVLEKSSGAYKHRYKKTHTCDAFVCEFETIKNEDIIEKTLTLAGRLIAKRGHGKAIFGNILDETGTSQIYIREDALGQEKFSEVLDMDIGDFIGVQGTPFRTNRGELSLRITKAEILTKSLLPLPEKYHGLQDKETRYRKRYIDLVANAEVRETFKKRSDIILNIRNFLNSKNFMEVETPILSNIYGGASAKPFTTFHNELKQNLFLRIALELPLKRLLVGGYENIFEIGRVFRNEGISYKHNPEYTLLELYQAFSDYNDMMVLTEELLSYLATSIHGSTSVNFQGKKINLSAPFKRLTFQCAIKEKLGVDIHNYKELFDKAKQLGLEPQENISTGKLIMDLYDKAIEPTLIEPTFMIDHPWETSPLAKKKEGNSAVVERFELIINGMEIANAFTELNDPVDQEERFKEQQEAKKTGDDEAHPMDNDFIEALKYGMPPAGGLGIGIDRIVMLLTDSASIRDVLFFPHMKDK